VISSVSKADLSPVTVADYGAQAALNLVLLHSLQGAGAVHAVLGGGSPPQPFRVVGEEDAGSLGSEDALLASVVAALSASMGPRAEFVGGGGGGGGGEWGGSDVLRAVGLGSCPGGLASEGQGDSRGYWVMDPIDGTKGYLRGGQYAVGLAYIQDGRPILAVMACPVLPYPAWTEAAAAAAASGTGSSSAQGASGALFAAVLGGGATQEPLFPEGPEQAEPLPISTARDRPLAQCTLCESFERGHSSHSTSSLVRSALGMGTAPIQMDSMGKYALVARGCGDLYFRCVPRCFIPFSSPSSHINALTIYVGGLHKT